MANIELKMEKLIEKLDDYRPDQVQEIQAMQKSLKQAMLKKNLKEHPSMKLLIKTLGDRERGYTLVLSNKEDLEEMKRHAYFARRSELRFILSFFDVDSTIKNIERDLDAELDNQLSGGDNNSALSE